MKRAKSGLFLEFKSFFSSQNRQLKSLGSDVRKIKGDVGQLQEEMAGVRRNVSQLQGETAGLRKELHQFKKESLGRFSDVMGELETIRNEMTIATHQHEELEERVEALEKQSTSSVSLP